MKVKHNFAKDATALLLGCLYLLGTSLQAQFGGDGLEQAKPPVTYELYGQRFCVFRDFYRTDKWFLPTSEKVYQASWNGNANSYGIYPGEIWCKMESNGKYSWWFQGHFESDTVKLPTDQPPPEPPNITGTTYDERIEILVPSILRGSKMESMPFLSPGDKEKLTLTPINVKATSAAYNWAYVVTNNTSDTIDYDFIEYFKQCHRLNFKRRSYEWVLKSGSYVHYARRIQPNKKVTISSRHPEGWFAGDWLAGKFTPPRIVMLDCFPLGGP